MASDYLLELDGIKGESQDSKHKECIEIDSFSWGCTNAGSMGRGSGGGTGKVSFQDIHFMKQTDKSTPVLVQAACTNKAVKKAVLYARKARARAVKSSITRSPCRTRSCRPISRRVMPVTVPCRRIPSA